MDGGKEIETKRKKKYEKMGKEKQNDNRKKEGQRTEWEKEKT